MIEFNYREELLKTGEFIIRPVAKVSLLRSDDEWIAEYFYIDSGADYTLMPYRMGKFLGLEKIATEVRDIGGIGGIIAVRLATIPDCTIGWAQIERVPFLLGRQDVFVHFDITFQQRLKKQFLHGINNINNP